MGDTTNNQIQLPANVAAEQAPLEPVIHVIPSEFYGAALKTKLKTEKNESAEGQAAPTKKSRVPILIGVLLLLILLGGAGAFVYFNREALFGKPTPPPVVVVQPTTTKPTPPPPPPPPSAPSSLSATSTGPQNVSLSWTDMANSETGYRVERRTGERTIYERITDLPPNSTNFQDGSVQASSTYYYRVIARNDTGESEPSNEAVAMTRPLPPPPPKQEPLPPAGLDTDSDGISDLEESLFGSDARNPDSDGDGFLDGNEVFNLYSPIGKAPAKLLESGLLKEISGSIGWSMLVPAKWTVAMDAPDGSLAAIDSGHGEKFLVSVEKNDSNLPLVDWYLAKYPGTDKSTLMQYRSKGGYEGLIGPDLLTTYIPWGNRVFVFKYDMGKQPFINFRTVYSMMLNSLALKGLPQEMVPAGTGQLPFEPAATQPGAVTQPVSITSVTATSPTNSTSTNP
jgi:flagellar basal body-associated protein FliL